MPDLTELIARIRDLGDDAAQQVRDATEGAIDAVRIYVDAPAGSHTYTPQSPDLARSWWRRAGVERGIARSGGLEDQFLALRRRCGELEAVVDRMLNSHLVDFTAAEITAGRVCECGVCQGARAALAGQTET